MRGQCGCGLAVSHKQRTVTVRFRTVICHRCTNPRRSVQVHESNSFWERMCAHPAVRSSGSQPGHARCHKQISQSRLSVSNIRYLDSCSIQARASGQQLPPASSARRRMLLQSSLLRGSCIASRPALVTSTARFWQTYTRCVRTGLPVTAAVAASQHKQMGWSWPFRNNVSGSKLQKLLEVATLFSHQPSAEALQDVKAALSECVRHHCIYRARLDACKPGQTHLDSLSSHFALCAMQGKCLSGSSGCMTQPHSLTCTAARLLRCARSMPSAISTCERTFVEGTSLKCAHSLNANPAADIGVAVFGAVLRTAMSAWASFPCAGGQYYHCMITLACTCCPGRVLYTLRDGHRHGLALIGPC